MAENDFNAQRCARCGYDLRWLTVPRCPECGLAFRVRDEPCACHHEEPAMLDHAEKAIARAVLQLAPALGLAAAVALLMFFWAEHAARAGEFDVLAVLTPPLLVYLAAVALIGGQLMRALYRNALRGIVGASLVFLVGSAVGAALLVLTILFLHRFSAGLRNLP